MSYISPQFSTAVSGETKETTYPFYLDVAVFSADYYQYYPVRSVSIYVSHDAQPSPAAVVTLPFINLHQQVLIANVPLVGGASKLDYYAVSNCDSEPVQGLNGTIYLYSTSLSSASTTNSFGNALFLLLMMAFVSQLQHHKSLNLKPYCSLTLRTVASTYRGPQPHLTPHTQF